MLDEYEARLRERAYAIWEREGRPDGRSDIHWRLAADEIADRENERGDFSIYARRAKPHEIAGEWEIAAGIWSEALATGTDRIQSAYRLADTLLRLNRPAEILEVVAGPLAEYPEHTWLLRFQAEAFRRLNRHVEALAPLGSITNLLPEHGGGYYSFSDSLNRLGRHEEALAAAKRAASLEPENPRFLSHLRLVEARNRESSSSS